MFWLALLAAVPTTHLYHVDLSRAVVATPEGRAAQAQLEAAREEQQARLQVQRERLLTRRGSLSPTAYTARVDALNHDIEVAEASLDSLQQEKVAPIVARFEALLAAEAKRVPTTRTVVLDDGNLLVPRPLCDRTGWLAQAYRGEAKPARADEACRVGRLAQVNLSEVLSKSRLAEAETRALATMQDKRQAELDRFRQEVTRLSAEARQSQDPRMAREAEGQRADLEQRFSRFQAELSAAERAAQTRTRAKLDAVVRAAQERHPKVVFLAAGPGLEGLDPTCEASPWILARLDGGDPAEPLPAACQPAP